MRSITLTRKQYYRFLSNVDQKSPDDCWNWLGSTNTCGYGKFPIDNTSVMAHRVAWIVKNGPIPDGLIVRHKCDNRKCVNPNHLIPGTQQDNSDDRVSRGRSARGERNHSKLKESQVREMRALKESGVATRALGRLFGVSSSTARHIIKRKKWSWLK